MWKIIPKISKNYVSTFLILILILLFVAFVKLKFVWICNLTWFRTLHCSLINQFKRLFQVKTANKRSNINKIIGGKQFGSPVCAHIVFKTNRSKWTTCFPVEIVLFSLTNERNASRENGICKVLGDIKTSLMKDIILSSKSGDISIICSSEDSEGD